MTSIQGVIIICIVAFILNLPFGMLRARTKKFSLAWFGYIHAPIPVVAAIRILSHTSWTYIPIFLLVSVAGQIIGAKIRTQPEIAD